MKKDKLANDENREGCHGLEIKKTFAFLLRTAIVYIILTVAVIILDKPGLALMFGTIGRIGADTLPPDIAVVLDPACSSDDPCGSLDTRIVVTTKSNLNKARRGENIFYREIKISRLNFFWTPLITYISLFLGSGLSMKRRVSRFATGLAVTIIFIYIRYTVSLHYALFKFNDFPPDNLFVKYAVTWGYYTTGKTLWSSSIAGLSVWLFACLYPEWGRPSKEKA